MVITSIRPDEEDKTMYSCEFKTPKAMGMTIGKTIDISFIR